MSAKGAPRLAFVGARSAFVAEDGIWTGAANGRLIDELAGRFPGLAVSLSRSPERRGFHVHRLAIAPEDFHPLPYLPGLKRGFSQAAACRRVIRRVEEESDALIVQLPFAAPLALLGGRRPRLWHLCADVLAQARTSPDYRGLGRPAALAAGWTVDRLQRTLVRRPGDRLVAHGRALYERYGSPPGRVVVSSSIRAAEIGGVARARSEGAPFRVLFVGFLRPEKGFDTLLAAFERLLAELPEAELEIVGASDRGSAAPVGTGDGGGDPAEAPLRAAAERLAARGTVRWLGPREYGEDLFRRFADADALAVPSRNEGTPRVLVEARAFGCPVVASRVGGIPTSIADGVDGLLVPPDDPPALAAALLRLARDPELRRRLVAGGFERARRTTLETFADALAAEAELTAAR